MLTNFKVFFEEELTSMLSSRLLKITEDFFYDRVLRSGDEHLNMSLLMISIGTGKTIVLFFSAEMLFSV